MYPTKRQSIHASHETEAAISTLTHLSIPTLPHPAHQHPAHPFIRPKIASRVKRVPFMVQWMVMLLFRGVRQPLAGTGVGSLMMMLLSDTDLCPVKRAQKTDILLLAKMGQWDGSDLSHDRHHNR